MTSAMLQQLLKCLATLSALLMAGAFLRAKVPQFRKLLLPASVIGGFIGLLLGPNVLGEYAVLRFPAEWITIWSLLPGILIVPIFSAVPLGMYMGASRGAGLGLKGTSRNALMTMGLFSAGGCFQCVLGFGTNMLFTKLDPSLNLYRTFGWELSQGYSGGHGTAGGVGGILEGYGLDYWATSQGVAMTTATVGLIGGMLLGIWFINRASRKGQTSLLTKTGVIPPDIARGFNNEPQTQKSLGRETMLSSSIETVSIHLAIMLAGCGIAYWLLAKLKATGIAAFAAVPVWFYALLVMYVINFILIKLKLDWMIDTKVKARITGTMSDFAIVAAISSVPVKAVLAFAVPLVFMCLLGFVVTYFVTFPLFKYCFKNDYSFERAIISWGTNTGVMITGMMLLKICDPDYESPALTDFSMGFSLMAITGLFTSPITYGLIANGSTMNNFLWALVSGVGYLAVALIARRMLKSPDQKEAPATVQ